MFNEIFKYDEGRLVNKTTSHIYCNKDRDGYIRVRILNKEFRAHRIIWELHYGIVPEGMLIDHIDGDTSNNRIENLRLATPQQNCSSSKVSFNKESGLPKGITLNPSGKYRARLMYQGITYSLGTFKELKDAQLAYNLKHYELNGEFFKESTQ